MAALVAQTPSLFNTTVRNNLGYGLRRAPADGELEAALAADGLTVVKGEFKCGGQEHFYLEANTTLEYLGISGNEIESKELRKKLREALTSKAA